MNQYGTNLYIKFISVKLISSDTHLSSSICLKKQIKLVSSEPFLKMRGHRGICHVIVVLEAVDQTAAATKEPPKTG